MCVVSQSMGNESESDAIKLGSHPVVSSLLANILEKEEVFLRNLALRKGVEPEDAAEVIDEAYLDLYRLKAQKEIAEILKKWVPTPENQERLRENLLALLVTYLKFKCFDYHRQRNRNAKRTVSLEDEKIQGSLPSIDDESLIRFFFEIGLLSNSDSVGLERGDHSVFERLVERLAIKAGLTERERAFVLFRLNNPDARDRDFDPSLKPYTITRIKQSALRKLGSFLER